ncbi:GDP-mannose transporter [Colletotrichum spaethianum]|uniref:GDP-mannose transporter n=1 Tax=Colletotrichum spaethianum TaxID=700344 RepID=A0AA37PCH8_9PEZI|nr:GDP-mannose transporter [Colletotrichum spaethianum]GKT49669.1 GDP-mannose transporter [Colletotrichum spaethianum]
MAQRTIEDTEQGIPLRGNSFDGEEEGDSLVGRARASPQRSSLLQPLSIADINNNAPVSVLAYCMASISMTVVNKYVVSGASWNLTFFYLAAQAIICIAVITMCKQAGMIKSLTPVTLDKSKKWFPISFLLVGMIYTSTKALQYLSVPVYTIFKNLTIIAIAYGEVFLWGGEVTRMATVAFSLMVLSSVVAAWADIRNALAGNMDDDSKDAIAILNTGYMWMALNVVCTATYTLSLRKVIKKMDFKDWDTMYYNNLLTIPILIVASLLTEDWGYNNLVKNFPEEQRDRICVGIVYSGLATIFISYCSAWCIRVTSSTTYSMVGALNKLPIAISGLIFFSAPVTIGSVSAIALGFVSGIVYAFAKKWETDAKKESLPTEDDDNNGSSNSNSVRP